jgi:outer membrane protein assembly factor BamB
VSIRLKRTKASEAAKRPWFVILLLIFSVSQQCLAFQGGEDSEENDAITLAPRALRRQITTAEDAIRDKRYAEAVETLGKILMEEVDEIDANAEDFSQDYFLERRAAGLIKGSIRGRAAELIESLPAENREAIEVRYGIAAKQQLESAVAQYDWNAIETVSRKYFHTSAGYEATLLIARRYRTDGRPMSAALMCERLLASPGAQRKFGVKLDLYTAECWAEASRVDNAMRILLAANEKFPGSQVDWNGKSFTLGPERIWMESDIGLVPRTAVNGTLSQDWWMAGGDATRTGNSTASLTMPNPKWQTPLTRGRPDEVRLRRFEESRNPAAPVLIGAAGATVVNDTIVYKTIDHALRGLDIQTGKVKWEQSLTSSPWETTPRMNAFAMDVDFVGADQLARRVWSEIPYWQLSTDGKKAFLVSKPTEADNQAALGGQLRPQFPNFGMMSQSLNYLEAFSIEGQGKAIWRVGGIDGVDEPKLAGAYFLGSPLWIDGVVYCLANLNGETTFLSLDPETGLVQWMQQLAQSPKQAFGDTTSDDASNIYLAYADGIIVCPTGTGVVVAIDIASRSLRWAFRYRDTTQINMSRGGPFNSPVRRDVDPLNERRWAGLPLFIANGRIVVASSESDQLFCLDLLTGEPQWTQRRDPYRYVGGVSDDRVLLVGDKSVVALSLSTGKLAWPAPLSLPEKQLVAGLGVRRNNSYFLPLQSQEIIEIEFSDGKILGTAKSDVPLGNLTAFREYVLNVSPYGMSLFHTQNDLKQTVNQRLAQNADDPWALARSSELLMLENKDQEALAVLQRAFKLHPKDDEIRFLMVRSILAALDSDFANNQSLASEIEPLIELRPQRIAFLIAMTKGHLSTNAPTQAIEPILSLIDIRSRERSENSADPYRMLRLASGHDVDIDSWLRAQIFDVIQKLNADQKSALSTRVAEYFKRTGNEDLLTRTNRLNYFPYLDTLTPFAMEVAKQWIDRGIGKGWLEAESILTRYTLATTVPNSNEAIEQLTKLYEVAGNKYAKQQLQIFNTIRSSDPDISSHNAINQIPFAIARSILWPTGQTKIELKSAENGMFRPATNPAKLVQSRSIPLAGFEARDGSDRVVLIGPDGRETLVVNCDAADGRAGAETRMMRSFLLVQRRTDILAIDTLGSYNDSRDALLWKIERFTPEALAAGASTTTQTRANTLGLELLRTSPSTDSVARLGPVFENCVILVRSGTIQALNLFNGTVLWSRDGFGVNCEFTQSEDRLIVLDASNKTRHVINALDGNIVSSEAFESSRVYLNSWNEFALDFKVESNSTDTDPIKENAQKQVNIRLWNTLTGATLLERDVTADAKAAFGLNRYFALMEPAGKLFYWDLATGVEQVQDLLPIEKLKQIYLVPVYDRFLLLTTSSKFEIEDVKVVPQQATSRTLFVNGNVYALDPKDGKKLWPEPATMVLINVAKLQSRYSPFLAFYRNLEWFDSKSQLQFNTSVALMDVRDGSVPFKSNLLMLAKTDTTSMESYPEQQIVNAKHGNQVLQVSWTGEPAQEKAIGNFGKISIEQLNDERKDAPENTLDSNTPFNLFDDDDPPR